MPLGVRLSFLPPIFLFKPATHNRVHGFESHCLRHIKNMLYLRYKTIRLNRRPGLFIAKIGEYCPGHIGDPKNNKPGGFKRFKRWEKLPVKAWKLYWRKK
jgi:hypothetical protein